MNAAIQDLLDGIPYVAWHGHRVLEERFGRAVVAQPARADLLNHVGTAHGGALFTLAETAAGIVADGLARPRGCMILLRGASVNYLRPATGRLIASAAVDAQAVSRLETQPDRAELTVVAQIDDGSEACVFRGEFHFVLKKGTL